jgi:hypothetical protein
MRTRFGTERHPHKRCSAWAWGRSAYPRARASAASVATLLAALGQGACRRIPSSSDAAPAAQGGRPAAGCQHLPEAWQVNDMLRDTEVLVAARAIRGCRPAVGAPPRVGTGTTDATRFEIMRWSARDAPGQGRQDLALAWFETNCANGGPLWGIAIFTRDPEASVRWSLPSIRELDRDGFIALAGPPTAADLSSLLTKMGMNPWDDGNVSNEVCGDGHLPFLADANAWPSDGGGGP